MNLQEIKNKVEQQKGKLLQLSEDIANLSTDVRTKEKALVRLGEAREIIKLVGLMTQQQLQFHIGDIASLALESIFPTPYTLLLDFVERRNKTECDIWFERDGNFISPLSASGGGAVDVASFTLRIASWSMSSPHTRPIVILDEPFRFLSAEYQEPASEMIHDISKKLGIQFIIITHNELLAARADKLFKTSIRRGITKITTL